MDSVPHIRDATSADVDTLVEIFCDSFAEDPVFSWVFRRQRLHEEFFRLVIEEVYLPRGMIHMEDSGAGAALWLPPKERFQIPPRIALLRFGINIIWFGGPWVLWRAHQQGAVFARHMPRDPHYYLQFIGCRKHMQGRGIGAALLKHGTRLCDEEEMPAYLESSNSRNVPLYERQGFEVQAQEAVAPGGPTAWFMWRQGRQQ